MTRRTIVGATLALIAAAAIPLGLPHMASAAAPSVVGYNALNVKPLPIEQPGTLNPTGTNTVTMCVQPLNGTKVVPVGTTVDLSIDVGLFNTVNPGVGGSAEVTSTSTALTSTPTAFQTVASCSYQNLEMTSPATVSDAIPITYTGPSTTQTTGRDIVAAASDAVSFDATTGMCVGPGVCNTGTYVFSPVTQYVITPSPTIASTGTLTAGAHATVTVKAEDAAGNPVPGAYLDLSLTTTASPGGSATAFSEISLTVKSLNNLPNRFGADSTGSVVVTYTTANPLPSSGTDTITAQNHPTLTFSAQTQYTYGATAPFSQAPYTPVTPFRVCDTRPVQPGIAANQCNDDSTGAGSGPIGSGATRVVTVGGVGGPVPSSGVTAVVVNVTAVNPSVGTFFSVSPDGVSAKNTSTLNPAKGVTLANLVEVGVTGSPGKIDVYNSVGTANLIVDIEGYVSSTSPGFYHPLAAPVRVCDTRGVKPGIASNQCNGGHTFPSPIVAGGPVLKFNVDAQGDGVPASNVSAVVFNLTAIAPTKKTVLTAYPSNVSKPNASNVNVNAAENLPNRVIVQVSSVDNTVSIWNSVGSANVAVDIAGYFDTNSAAQFTAIAPARVCDTRLGNPSVQFCPKALVRGGQVLNIDVAGIAGIPAEGAPHAPLAIIANVTATAASANSFVTAYPGTAGRPNVSDLNVTRGVIATNLVVITVGSDGTISLFNDVGSLNLIVDILGYYS